MRFHFHKWEYFKQAEHKECSILRCCKKRDKREAFVKELNKWVD
jgi:hypothetical protein